MPVDLVWVHGHFHSDRGDKELFRMYYDDEEMEILKALENGLLDLRVPSPTELAEIREMAGDTSL